MRAIEILTIGFTKTTASRFFARIKTSNVKKMIDVRLHNTSQLAGFAKAGDLTFFLKEICGAEYAHEPLFAPTDEMLKTYKRNKGGWENYEKYFLDLMKQRKIEEKIDPSTIEGACLLCSEDQPHKCHRRLVCEYLNEKWGGGITMRHL